MELFSTASPLGMPSPMLLCMGKRVQSSHLKPGMSRDWLLDCHCPLNTSLVTSRLLHRGKWSPWPFCWTAKAPGIWAHSKVNSEHFWFLRCLWKWNYVLLGAPPGDFFSKICSCYKRVSVSVWLQHAASACQNQMQLRPNPSLCFNLHELKC